MATYTVKKGDTLSAIAKQYGTTYQEIAKANGISDPNKIYAGQTLNIGGTAQTTAPKTTAPTPAAPAPKTDTSFKYEQFNYVNPAESDVVKQAEALLQQQMNNKPGEFQYAYDSQLQETINKILNGEKFSYDLNGDALYQQYKDQYTTQGKLSSMDGMGQAAAMNGGYGSSYGQTVGHQAYQGYLQQLNDRVPELYQLALSQYNQERQDLKDQASLLAQQKQQEYGIHRDGVTDWKDMLKYYTDNYNTTYDRVDDEQKFKYDMHNDQQNINYQLSRDAIEDANTAKKEAYDLAELMLGMGLTPEADLLAKAGISFKAAQDIANKVKADEAAASAKGSSGSSGGGYEADDDGGIALWKPTGTYDDKGNQIFRNTDGKTQAFGAGTNPYTGGIHKDAKTNGKYDSSKVFSNGYQPNNIGGKKLKAQAEYEVYVNGNRQSVWSYDGGKTLWAWDGSINDYIDVTSKKDELKK